MKVDGLELLRFSKEIEKLLGVSFQRRGHLKDEDIVSNHLYDVVDAVGDILVALEDGHEFLVGNRSVCVVFGEVNGYELFLAYRERLKRDRESARIVRYYIEVPKEINEGILGYLEKRGVHFQEVGKEEI